MKDEGSSKGKASHLQTLLASAQSQLSQRLDKLRRGLQRFGMQSPSQLDGAQRSMENAERALREGNLAEATREQSRALEQLRQGTRSMAETYNAANAVAIWPVLRTRRSIPSAARNARKARTLGPASSYPTEIDAQVAREILNELRRRLGERYRPELELQYLERLLRRF